jgi:hypothetical protein
VTESKKLAHRSSKKRKDYSGAAMNIKEEYREQPSLKQLAKIATAGLRDIRQTHLNQEERKHRRL